MGLPNMYLTSYCTMKSRPHSSMAWRKTNSRTFLDVHAVMFESAVGLVAERCKETVNVVA